MLHIQKCIIYYSQPLITQLQFDYFIMEGSHLISQKKRQWTAKIRRRQIEEVFRKKRTELLFYSPYTGNHLLSDQQKIEQICSIITNFSLDNSTAIIKYVVKMDPSLSLFFQITGVNGQTPPQLIISIIQQILIRPQKTILGISKMQFWDDPQWIRQNNEQIQTIKCLMNVWIQNDCLKLSQIMALIRSLTDFNLVIKSQIIYFLSFTANVLLIGYWAQAITQFGMKNQEKESIISIRLNSCVNVLTNILAGPDEQLIQFLNEIFINVGNHIKFLPLYLNLFLIKQDDNHLKLSFIRGYISIVDQDRDYLLQSHQQVIHQLRIGINNLNRLKQEEQSEFVNTCSVLASLLNQIMKIQHMRYDSPLMSTSSEADLVFLNQFADILLVLSRNKLVCRILMEKGSESIKQFFFAHFKSWETGAILSLSHTISQTLTNITSDEIAFESFCQDQRFFIRCMTLLETNYKNIKSISCEKYCQFVGQCFCILGNCCSSSRLFKKMLIDKQILPLLEKFFNKIPQKAATLIAKIDLLYLYSNLLSKTKYFLQGNWNSYNTLLQNFFKTKTCQKIFLELLNPYSPRQLNKKAIDFIRSCIQMSQDHILSPSTQAFLKSQDLEAQLYNLIQNGGNISQEAQCIFNALRQNNKTLHHNNPLQNDDNYL